MKRCKGFTILQFAICTMIIILLFSVPIYGSKNTMLQNREAEQLKFQSIVLDRSLAMWYASHAQKYPANLTLLQTINYIPQSIAISNFTYTVNGDGTYTLIANLPSGGTYKSPGSK